MAEPVEATLGGGIRVVAFDAYGTLFDVAAAARQASREPAHAGLRESWPRIAAAWRTRQLEYTWLRSLAGAHGDFWRVTQDALDWTLEHEGLHDDAALRRRLLDLYWELAAYPEAADALQRLRKAGHSISILSNGSAQMLEAAVSSAGIANLIDAVISVDSVGIFKPHPNVYALVCSRFECRPESVAFVSANGWDAAAGSGFGFRAIWANREGAPGERLPWSPEAEVGDLSAVPQAVEAMHKGTSP